MSMKKEIYHHGIKGQRWGVRRYQNPDGTLTEEGKRRYDSGDEAFNTIRDYYVKARKNASDVATRAQWQRRTIFSKNEKRIFKDYGAAANVFHQYATTKISEIEDLADRGQLDPQEAKQRVDKIMKLYGELTLIDLNEYRIRK